MYPSMNLGMYMPTNYTGGASGYSGSNMYGTANPYGGVQNAGSSYGITINNGYPSMATSFPGGSYGNYGGNSGGMNSNQGLTSMMTQMMGMMMTLLNQVLGQGGGGQAGGYQNCGPQQQMDTNGGFGNSNNGWGFQNGGNNINFGGGNNGGINIGINNGGNNGNWGGVSNNSPWQPNQGGSYDKGPSGGGQYGHGGGYDKAGNGHNGGNNNVVIINNNYYDYGDDNCQTHQPPTNCEPEKPTQPPDYDGGTDGRCWGDPHLVGFDGEKYDVMGQPGKTYNMLSDQKVQYNTQFESWGTDGATIIAKAGIQVGDDKVAFDRSGAAPTVNGKAMTKGQNVQLDDGGSATWDGSQLVVNTKEYTIDLKTVKNAKGDYLDSNVKINAGGPFQDYVAPHGLLGQTADGIAGQKDSGKNQGKQGGTVIDGTVNDYQVNDLWGKDAKYNRFGVEVGQKITDDQGNVEKVLDKNGNVIYLKPEQAVSGEAGVSNTK